MIHNVNSQLLHYSVPVCGIPTVVHHIFVSGRTLTLPIVSNYHMITSPFLKTTVQAHRASLSADTPTSPSVAPNLAMRSGNDFYSISAKIRQLTTYILPPSIEHFLDN